MGLRRKRNRDKMEINCSCPPRKLKNVISGELLSKFCELRLVFAESLVPLCLFILYRVITVSACFGSNTFNRSLPVLWKQESYFCCIVGL